MNVQLIPYGLPRRLELAVRLAGAALVAWLVAVGGVVSGGQAAEGPLLLGGLALGVTGTGLAASGANGLRVLGGAVLAAVGAWALQALAAMAAPEGVVSLRSHLPAWLGLGLATGLSWAALRRRQGASVGAHVLSHAAGTTAAAGAAAAVWHCAGHYPALGGDLYVGSALAAATFGAGAGLLAWVRPEESWAGFVRVAGAPRWLEVTEQERFVGHLARGLDLVLPAEAGVSELHASFLRDDRGRFLVRGLSQAPTSVVRPRERVDLRASAGRPAPLETELRHGDRIDLGHPGVSLRFLRRPRPAAS